MEPNPSRDQATLETITELVKQHVSEQLYTAFSRWAKRLPHDGRRKFLEEMRPFTIHTVIPINSARQPEQDLPRKAGEAVGYAAVALWKLHELREATRRDDETG